MWSFGVGGFTTSLKEEKASKKSSAHRAAGEGANGERKERIGGV